MPQASLNNAVTTDTYSDALTVEFGRARPAFSVQVFNAAVYYQVALYPHAGGAVEWEPAEHYSPPSLNSFREPSAEGFPAGRHFGGIRFRSAVAGVPGRVTVA